MILDLQKERTFSLFLQSALDSCCDGLKEETEATITAANERYNALQGEIDAELSALIGLSSANGFSEGTLEMYWTDLLSAAALDGPAFGASEYPTYSFDPLTCELDTQVLVSLTLPSLATQIEQQKIDLAFYQSQAAGLCSSLSSGVSADPMTTSTGRSLSPANCASVRSGLMARLGESNAGLEGLSLEDLRATILQVVNYTPDVTLSVPTLNAEALAACGGDTSETFAATADYEQCINDVEDFDAYLFGQCSFTEAAIIGAAADLDTAASDAGLMANADFMSYTVLTGDMEFEITRTLGLLEEGCAVVPVTPDTYDYCG